MPRKTKAELAAEATLARALAERMARDEYPARLMAALEEATNESNYELTVVNGMFALRDRDDRYGSVLSLTAAYTENSYNALENLEMELEMKAEERAEANRRVALKHAALAKLSTEEREVLGL